LLELELAGAHLGPHENGLPRFTGRARCFTRLRLAKPLIRKGERLRYAGELGKPSAIGLATLVALTPFAAPTVGVGRRLELDDIRG
jgi:hypothetical protein